MLSESSGSALSAVFTFEVSNYFLMLEQLSPVGLLDAQFYSFQKQSSLFQNAQSGVFHYLRHSCAVMVGYLRELRFLLWGEINFHIRECKRGASRCQTSSRSGPRRSGASPLYARAEP